MAVKLFGEIARAQASSRHPVGHILRRLIDISQIAVQKGNFRSLQKAVALCSMDDPFILIYACGFSCNPSRVFERVSLRFWRSQAEGFLSYFFYPDCPHRCEVVPRNPLAAERVVYSEQRDTAFCSLRKLPFCTAIWLMSIRRLKICPTGCLDEAWDLAISPKIFLKKFLPRQLSTIPLTK